MLLLLYDALKWIRNIFDWFIRNMAARNVCERAPARIQIRYGSQENRTNWVSDAVYYITLATAKCFSIQAIKLVRLIYWAWTAEAYSRIDTHKRSEQQKGPMCERGTVKLKRSEWENIRKLYLCNMHYSHSSAKRTLSALYHIQNDVYHTCYWSLAMLLYELFVVVVFEKKEFLYVRNLNVCVCVCASVNVCFVVAASLRTCAVVS